MTLKVCHQQKWCMLLLSTNQTSDMCADVCMQLQNPDQKHWYVAQFFHQQTNLHEPTITWNNNELMLHKQLMKWSKGLEWIPYWGRKSINGERTLDV